MTHESKRKVDALLPYFFVVSYYAVNLRGTNLCYADSSMQVKNDLHGKSRAIITIFLISIRANYSVRHHSASIPVNRTEKLIHFSISQCIIRIFFLKKHGNAFCFSQFRSSISTFLGFNGET